MEALNEQELGVLRVLADEWDRSGPPGFLETAAVAQSLGIPIHEARKTIHALFVRGLVGTDEIEIYAGYLLPEGYEVARGGTFDSHEMRTGDGRTSDRGGQ